jgi:nucleoside-diphosphate-sugar epimerase
MSKIAKVLVTGGAGFIGSHLVPYLLEKGYSVTVLDNLSSGKKENLGQALNHPHFEFAQGDIRNKENLHEAFEGVNVVVHLAALIDVTASVANPGLANDINVTGTLNVLQETLKSRVPRFVFASSTAIYGDVKELPVKEDAPPKPISPYAASKAAGEAYCNAFAVSFGIETVALRFFNVYGPKNENSPYSGVITKFIRQALKSEVLTVDGDGEQTRDFIHVNDVAKALTLAIEAKKLRCETINVCTGVPTSINELADAIQRVAGKKLHLKHGSPRVGDIRFSYGDGSNAFEKLGFKASVTILDGLKLLYGEAQDAMEVDGLK